MDFTCFRIICGLVHRSAQTNAAYLLLHLKPGGILANRELICDPSFMEPSSEGLAGGWDTFTNLLAANGGHPQMGKELKRAYSASSPWQKS